MFNFTTFTSARKRNLKNRIRRQFERLEKFWEHIRWEKYNSAVDDLGNTVVSMAAGGALTYFYMCGHLDEVRWLPFAEAALGALAVGYTGGRWLRWMAPAHHGMQEWAPRIGLVTGLTYGALVLVAGALTASLALAVTVLAAWFAKEIAVPAWRSMWRGQRTFEGDVA